MSGERLDRRNFFRHGLRSLARTVADSVSSDTSPAGASAAATDGRPFRRLRPPGALLEPAFLEACTRCDACFDACPVDAIVPVPEGHLDAGTPRILAAETACTVCSSLACTQVCEPGALLPLQSPQEIEMGLARVDPQHCVTHHGQACDACVTICPTQPPALGLLAAFATGLLAFPFGKTVLELLRVRDPAARGLALAGAAHGGGLLAISDEPEAFPFAALGMNLFGACAVTLVSVPPVARLLRAVAGM